MVCSEGRGRCEGDTHLRRLVSDSVNLLDFRSDFEWQKYTYIFYIWVALIQCAWDEPEKVSKPRRG